MTFRSILYILAVIFSLAPTCIAKEQPSFFLYSVSPKDITLGQKDAPAVLITYTSLTCEHCAEFHTDYLPKFKPLIDAGKLRVVFRHYPLDKIAFSAAIVVDSKPLKDRLPLIDVLFAKQADWLEKAENEEKLIELCGETPESYFRCINDESLQEPILEKQLFAKQTYNIDATPSFLVNGELCEGLPPFEEMEQMVLKNL